MRSGSAEVAGGEGGADLGEDPLLLAAEQLAEELVLGVEAGVDDGLGDAGGAADRLHRGAVVAALEEELEGGVEHLGAAALGTQMRGAGPLDDGGRARHCYSE